MILTSTALSFILLSVGLTACGWKFLSAFQASRSTEPPSKIGSLLSSLFFIGAGYNLILGFGSLFISKSPLGLFILLALSYAALTALAILSVYTLYYIFRPDDSPRPLLVALGLMGCAGLILNSPFITFCLLTISFLATFYIFFKLFRSSTGTLKGLSLTFSTITLFGVVHAALQFCVSSQLFNTASLSITDLVLIALLGTAFLLACIETLPMKGAIGIFLALLGWWAIVQSEPATETAGLNNPQEIWSFAIQAIALWGIWFGFKMAHKHGGFKTALGKAINLFTLGLAIQILAHNFYYFYVFFLNTETPFPSPVDIGYIGSAILYLIATVFLGRALLINYNLKAIRGKFWGVLLFVITFSLGCSTLWPGYLLDWNQPMKVVLDIAYPLIESLGLAILLLIYLSKEKKYETAKNPLFLIALALFIQYTADAAYSYMLDSGMWPDGSVGDILYLSAYFLMAVALIRLGNHQTETTPAITDADYELIKSDSAVIPPKTVGSPANWPLRGAIALFAIFLSWWVMLYFNFEGNVAKIGSSLWTDIYSLIILLGVWFGFRQARKTGLKTNLGKAISCFTLGLFLQSAGGVIYGFYVNWLSVPIPYPSFADIGWFGSIIFYVLGAIFLVKTLGTHQILSTFSGKLKLILPAIIAFSFYWLAVMQAGYTFNWQEPLKTFLDIAYSVIGASYVTIGMLSFFITKHAHSIITRKQILLVLVALGTQFLSDTNFIYQTTKGTWIDGSYGDLLLLTSYFLMGTALIKLDSKSQAANHLPVDPYVKLQHPTSRLASRVKRPNIYSKALAEFISIRSKNRSKKKSNASGTYYDVSKL